MNCSSVFARRPERDLSTICTSRTTWSCLPPAAWCTGRELFTDETPSTSSVELSLGSQVEWFVFNRPKTRVTNYFLVFPNLTTPGRVRLELNTGVRRELFKDFFIDLSFVDSYDNRPPSADARSDDLTLVTSLGWSF